jgi:secondary thiamine-phosphate synthase enzyme
LEAEPAATKEGSVAASVFVKVEQGGMVRACRDLVSLRTERPFQVIDLTGLVAERVRRSGVVEGTVVVQSRHTTASVIVQENEPLLLEDLHDLLERWAPASAPYRHDDLAARTRTAPDERKNGHAHARACLLGTSVALNIASGRLDVGEWQSVLLVELDGPRPRTLSVQVLGIPEGDRG